METACRLLKRRHFYLEYEGPGRRLAVSSEANTIRGKADGNGRMASPRGEAVIEDD